MARLIFINRYFHPDVSASSQILSDLAFHLAQLGWEVHIVTGNQLYDDPSASLPAFERVNNVTVHRLTTTRFGRTALVGRTVDYLSFHAALSRRLRRLVEPGDIVIAKTDPPMIATVAARVTRRKRGRLINWLQDFYPEIAIALGMRALRGPHGRALALVRDGFLRAADVNVVVGERMAQKVVERGIAKDRVQIIHNWANDTKIQPVTSTANSLRKAWQLQDKFVVGYSGNLGRAHEFETILGAAIRLRDRPDIVFLCIGGGHRFNELSQRAEQNGLGAHFRFVQYQDQRFLPLSLGVPDVHWISLRPELEGLVVPSKFYGIAAAGRPIVAITSKTGEFAATIDEHQCGRVIEPGQVDALVATLIEFSNNPALCIAMGSRARAMLDARFSRRQAFEHWTRLLENLPS